MPAVLEVGLCYVCLLGEFFFSRKKAAPNNQGDYYILIGALNAPWVLFAALGLYVSAHLILDGDNRVLGF